MGRQKHHRTKKEAAKLPCLARVVAWVKNPDPSHIKKFQVYTYIYIINYTYIYIYMVGKPKSAGS
jgi:hypothetical protein